jgi:tetratricopeptide (TPR) repeat protein
MNSSPKPTWTFYLGERQRVKHGSTSISSTSIDCRSCLQRLEFRITRARLALICLSASYLFMWRFLTLAACNLAVTAIFLSPMVLGQSTAVTANEATSNSGATATLHGVVRDSLNRPVAGAIICLQGQNLQVLKVRTDSAGAYVFPELRQGNYSLRAEMAGYISANFRPIILESKESKAIDLKLDSVKPAATKASDGPPEFFDEPHFNVAGITDTTNLGGHGGDTIVRNREALAQETAAREKQSLSGAPLDSSRVAMEQSLRDAATLRPQDFSANFRLGKLLVEDAKPQEGLRYLERAYRLNPRDIDNASEMALARADTGDYAQARSDVRALLTVQGNSHQENAELHHLLAEADEKLGDPLEAVREYQRAAELNPSETNLFDWGAELLLHHAAEPAIEVFSKGHRSFPRSVRMLDGLGSAWYSNGSYEAALQKFCEASDLNPDDPNPYLFMGEMQAVEVTSSPEIEQRLARFVRLQPRNAWANYYYAISLHKRWSSPDQPEDVDQVKSLLQTAIQLDPKFGLAYLQLGVLYSEEKNFPQAILALQHAIDLDPELEKAHYRLAQLYRLAGESKKSQSELQLYEKITREKTEEAGRQRHELQQFVYELRDRTTGPQPQ